MLRPFLIILCLAAFPAYASEFDEVSKELFESDGKTVKAELRTCVKDADCTSVLSMCRWRPVNNMSKEQATQLSSLVQLECKWPPPPPNPPVARCVNQLCDILPDGRYY